MYDTGTNLSTYTGSENIDTTNSEIPFNFALKVNDEIVFGPRLNGYFDLYAATNGIAFLRNIVDGGQPIAIFSSLDKSVEFFSGLDILNFLQ